MARDGYRTWGTGLTTAKAFGISGKSLGGVGVAIDGLYSGNRAYDAYMRGDTKSVGHEVGGFFGGTLGAGAGVALVGAACGATGGIGCAVGAGLAAGAGGVFGDYLGGIAGRDLGSGW